MSLSYIAAAHAQTSPAKPIGQIQGADVSVTGGIAASEVPVDSPPSIYVSNGSVVVVHSGHARLTLSAGGEIDVCGPAKFTTLSSGSDLTVALNFGRLHLRLPAKTSLRIFSPSIVATPIDINGGPREVTIGLDLNDSLCVLATSGAIQLENQFTSGKLIIPQAGSFALNGGALAPVAETSGNCGCASMPDHAIPRAPASIPAFAQAGPTTPHAAPEPAKPSAPVPAIAVEVPTTTANVQAGAPFVIPLNPSGSRPIERPELQSTGEAPAIPGVRGNVTPMLAFMASSPPPPDASEAEMMLLVREARESANWEFEGRVDAPDFAKAMRHALGEGPGTPNRPAKRRRQTKSHGFWTALKNLFFGKVEADERQ